MTVIGISASPRKGGNSETALISFMDGVVERGEESKIIRLADLAFAPCRACDGCKKNGRCIVKDDMQQLYPLIEECSGLVLATPIYFGNVSAQLKMFIDRFQCWWQAKYRLHTPFVTAAENKPAYFICVNAARKKQFAEDADKTARFFMMNINFTYRGSLCFQCLDSKGAINDYPKYLEEAFSAGINFIDNKNDGALKIFQ